MSRHIYHVHLLLYLLAFVPSSLELFFDPPQLAGIILQEANSAASTVSSSFLLTDSAGQPTSNASEAWGCSYEACMKYSSSPNAWTFISWDQFVPMFGTWLLPWLALTAQLPAQAKGHATNLLSIFLALGSPMLAAYSLSLAVLNSRWINWTFRREREEWMNKTPANELRARLDAIQAARNILIESQYTPIRITRGKHNDFAQVVERTENTNWWTNLEKEILKGKGEKVLSQLGWVFVAQILAIVQFFMTGADNNSVVVSMAINTLWTWMLPVVWGWVYVGTPTKADSIRDAIRAIPVPQIEDPKGVRQQHYEVLLSRCHDRQAMFHGFSIVGWEQEPGPMFTYARTWSHMTACEIVRKAWETVSKGQEGTEYAKSSKEFTRNRLADMDSSTQPIERPLISGSFGDVESQRDLPVHSAAPDGIWLHFVLSVAVGLLLQWGTTGSAIMMAYQTPVIGLGCESGAYLLYGTFATVACCLLMLSAWLSHRWSCKDEKGKPEQATWHSIGGFAVITRLMGNTLAVLNGVFVLTISFLQYTNMFNNCWCASAFFQWGPRSWVLLFATDSQIWDAANQYWSSGAFLGLLFTFLAGAFFMLAKGDDIY